MPKFGSTVLTTVACALTLGACEGCHDEEERQRDGEEDERPPVVETDPLPPATGDDDGFVDEPSTIRFLTQATFGPTRADVARLSGVSASAWFVEQMNETPSLLVDSVENYVRYLEQEIGPDRDLYVGDFYFDTTNFAAWNHYVMGPDQLRLRMGFALSQMFVVSNAVGDELTEHPHAVASFGDHLTRNAFGNFRDLLEDVTYSAAMGVYLTYNGNAKADPVSGRVPDENYAREILQLFSTGLVELKPDGTPRRDGDGNAIEIYDNTDITGLAKVFTGLNVADGDSDLRWARPMEIVEEDHSTDEKTFLGQTIPVNTGARQSIDQALDIIFAHPNVGPFVGRQLIQRFVTSDPHPTYVQRVAATFDAGQFALPDGTSVGTGQRGDLAATLAAILFDAEARTKSAATDPGFGKIREPVLVLTHWARAFGADFSHPEYWQPLSNPDRIFTYSQQPYQAPSVFNFYRPGYVAPGTVTGAAGMTVPELQIVTSTNVAADSNFLQALVFRNAEEVDVEGVVDLFEGEFGIRTPTDEDAILDALVPDYTDELALAEDPVGLVAELDRFLCFGSMTPETEDEIETILAEVTDEELRIPLGVYLVMTSADYLVQR
ncbi:MAG: DUF1800 family protein [Myxococcota bacterium]